MRPVLGSPGQPFHSNSSQCHTPPSALGNVHVAHFSQVAHSPLEFATDTSDGPVVRDSMVCNSATALDLAHGPLDPAPQNSSQNSTARPARPGKVQSRSWTHAVQRPLGGEGRSTCLPPSLSPQCFSPELLAERFGPDGSGRSGLEECEPCILYLPTPARTADPIQSLSCGKRRSFLRTLLTVPNTVCRSRKRTGLLRSARAT